MKAIFTPVSATGYSVEYNGEYIGLVDRIPRLDKWWYENDGGAYGERRTRKAATNALIELSGHK